MIDINLKKKSWFWWNLNYSLL